MISPRLSVGWPPENIRRGRQPASSGFRTGTQALECLALAGGVVLAAKFCGAIAAFLLASAPALAQDMPGEADFPTTEFADGATSASVSVGDLTAGISMVRKPEIDPEADVPLLSVFVSGNRVLEVAGAASGMDFPAADASIANIDPDSSRPEVYFSSYSGGAHCCSTVIVAAELGGKWSAVTVGEFDGDGNYLADLNGDGLAEIATVDNRFLYEFDCYACSAAPLEIRIVRGGEVVDVSAESRFQNAHRDWLRQIEEAVDPAERWSSKGFLAGWVAQKARLGEGQAAFDELLRNFDVASDEGEQVCVTGGEPEDCQPSDLAVLKFPDRLKLFLQQTGYL
jgi:hypothetical protein